MTAYCASPGAATAPLAVTSLPVSELTRVALRFRFLALLRASLVAGALYDFGVAVLMVAAPQVLSRAFAVPLPGERFYLHLLALLLLMLSGLYLLAARDPRRYSGVVAIAIAGRLVGGVLFAYAALTEPAHAGLWWTAAADAALGISLAAFWWPL
jgi:hypothetical protein